MLNSILVPLDGSQLAECVLPHIPGIARPFESEIILLRMLERNQSGLSGQAFDLLNWQINKTQATLYLEKTEELFRDCSLRTQATVLEGLVAEGITEFAQSQDMKLIILSSHGRNGLNQWSVSSITQKIILSAQTSLLIIRADQNGANPVDGKESHYYPRILVPLDGSQRSENVLPVITQLARFHQSQIHLAQVVQTPEMARQMPPSREDLELSSQLVARNQAEAGRYLDEVKARSTLEGIPVQTHLINSDNAAVALHQLAEQEHIDIVAMSAHGYSGSHQWPYGSMVNNFILYGKTHLLIVQDLPHKQELTPLEMVSTERAER
jgi:nucleotide-binding universal stress UspA family protein